MYTVGPGTLEAFNSKCYILVIAVTVNINIGQRVLQPIVELALMESMNWCWH